MKKNLLFLIENGFYNFQRKKKKYFDYDLTSTLDYTPDELYEFKFSKIKSLLKYSNMFVPYYIQLFKDHKINIHNIKDLENYEEIIPILRKKDIINNYNKLISTKIEYPPLIKNSTGGSTGEPTNFLQDQLYLNIREISSIRSLKFDGWNFGDYKKAHLWGSNRDIIQSSSNLKQKIAYKYLNKRFFLNSFKMNNQDMHSFYNKINKLKPSILIGYASSLYFYANYLEDHELRFNHKNFSIRSSAEVLYPEMRDKIEKIFENKVKNFYGSREIANIAQECDYHTGLHINEDLMHFEITKKTNNNNYSSDSGEIILTNFWNLCFPLIRYANGDLATLASQTPCNCNRRNFRRIKKIIGRTTDLIILRSGLVVHGEYFTHLFYMQDFVSNFQVIQENLDTIIIKYVLKDSKISKNEIDQYLGKMKKKIRLEIDENLEIEFEHALEIKSLKSGKKQFIFSKIN